MDQDQSPALDVRRNAASEESVTGYVAVSRAAAARGDHRMAVLAVWAADLQVLTTLLWERGLGSAPDPQAQLEAVAEAVSAAVADRAAAIQAPVTSRELVEGARRAMQEAFDPSVHALLAERLVDFEHLDPARSDGPDRSAATDDDRPAAPAVGRLAGLDPRRLVEDLRATARDCAAVAALMRTEGDLAGAAHQVRQSALASFEAYLVLAALGAGDTTGTTVDLRWAWAEVSARDEERELRAHLLAAVGPVEARDLESFLRAGASGPA